MSRLPSAGDQIVVQPANNVYTGLALVACVLTLIGLVILWVMSVKMFGVSPFSSGT